MGGSRRFWVERGQGSGGYFGSDDESDVEFRSLLRGRYRDKKN